MLHRRPSHPLAPARFKFADADYRPGSGQDLQYPPYTTRVRLTDGGVYDNLGLETAWKRCQVVLVSDAGSRVRPKANPAGDWILQSLRVEDLIYSQVGNLRKRQLIASYESGERSGTYWGIWSDIGDYDLPSALPCPVEKTTELARTPTRLASLTEERKCRLINWGYAICDAAIRKHYAVTTPPRGFPYPGGVG